MKKIFSTFIFTLFTFNFNASIMGMSFHITPDSNYRGLIRDSVSTEEYIKNLNKIRFPSGLSWFFERVGGFGETSEFVQIQKILNIDLSVFNYENFPSDEDFHEEIGDNWITVDSLLNTIDELTSRIELNPTYFNSVRYEKRFSTELEYHNLSNPFEKFSITYPVENDYLSSRDFEKDLNQLKEVLIFLKSEGVEKVNFQYY